ncbi:MAG: hypothetical protein LBI95_03825 [Holosporales bacterium]|nr:hypothetical protein [Holosporales bacterium]
MVYCLSRLSYAGFMLCLSSAAGFQAFKSIVSGGTLMPEIGRIHSYS